MKNLDLFNLSEGRRRRDKAMVQVNRDGLYAANAFEWVRRQGEGKVFTTDDIVAAVGFPTCDARALGPVLMRCRRTGLIEREGFTQCTRPSRHAGTLTVWRRL